MAIKTILAILTFCVLSSSASAQWQPTGPWQPMGQWQPVRTAKFECRSGIMHDGVCFSSVQLAMQYGYRPPRAAVVVVPPPVVVAQRAPVERDVVILPPNRRPGMHRGERRALTPAQREQLNELLDIQTEEVLGPRAENSRGFVGLKNGRQRVPHGCTEDKRQSPDGRHTLVRVDCPPGAGRR